MPSRSGGFGSMSQISIPHDPAITVTRSVFLNHRLRNAVIPSGARDPTHELWNTLTIKCDPSPWAGSLTSFGMTCAFTAGNSKTHAVTKIFPPTPRPLTPRSYIDCANTGGTMNSPRLHDLISESIFSVARDAG